MNQKGQVVFYGLMLGVVIIILGLSLSGVIKERVDNSRNVTTDTGETGLDCTNSSISDYQNAACITTDLTIFYVVGGLIFIGFLVIGSKIVFT